LLQGFDQIALGAFVFPAKVTALAHISPAVAATGFFGAALKAVVVGVARFGNTQQVAQVVKVGLRPGAFGQRVVSPASDEFLGCQSGVSLRSACFVVFECDACRQLQTPWAQIINDVDDRLNDGAVSPLLTDVQGVLTSRQARYVPSTALARAKLTTINMPQPLNDRLCMIQASAADNPFKASMSQNKGFRG